MLRNALAVVNPAAGRGRALRVWEEVRAVLRGAGMEVEAELTARPGHATALAQEALRGERSAVLAVGGDGTIHEVANGLLRGSGGRRSAIPLGVVPAGSGNDFAKPLGIPADGVGAARALLASTPRWVDAGRAGDRYFVNGVGIGFDASVAAEARSIRRLRGTALYGWALLRVLHRHRPATLRVVLDGVEVVHRPLTLVTIANGPCCGGGFRLCPAARIDDARLDVLVACARSRSGILGLLLRSLRGRHRGRPGVHLQRARTIHVSGEMPLPVHVDGELLSAPVRDLEIRVLPGALSVLSPA